MQNSHLLENTKSADPYYATREFLIPQYRYLPAEDIESLLGETFPEMSPEDAESFFRDIGRSLGKFGSEVGRRAPGILAGAATGAKTGAALGPFGALAGALAGGAFGGATYRPQPGTPSATGIAQQIGGQTLGALSGNGGTAGLIGQLGNSVMGALASGDRGAGGQLAAMLSQPQTLQAVLNAMTGSAGSRSISAGGRSMRVPSILSALGTLATRAAEEYEIAEETVLGGAFGESAFDRANPDEQATYILETLFQENESLLREYDEGGNEDDEAYDEYGESDEDYDEVSEFDVSFYEFLEDFEYDNDDD